MSLPIVNEKQDLDENQVSVNSESKILIVNKMC